VVLPRCTCTPCPFTRCLFLCYLSCITVWVVRATAFGFFRLGGGHNYSLAFAIKLYLPCLPYCCLPIYILFMLLLPWTRRMYAALFWAGRTGASGVRLRMENWVPYCSGWGCDPGELWRIYGYLPILHLCRYYFAL